MGIIDEALRALGESEERIEQVRAAAIQRQVKYLEDNASGDADGHWEFWRDGLYVESLKEFKKFIQDGTVKGSILSDIISKVNPFLKKIKNMPDPNAVDTNLTYESYSECEPLRQLEQSFFNMFDKRATQLGSDDAGKILADILKKIVEELTKWIAANSDLSEDQVGFRAAGVQNEVEFALSNNAPVLHSMSKNWYGEKLTEILTGANTDSAVDVVGHRMIDDLRERVKSDLPEYEALLHFINDEKLLPSDVDQLEKHSQAGSLDACATDIESSIELKSLETAKNTFGPKIDAINSTYNPKTMSGSIGIPAKSKILQTMSDEIKRDLDVDDIEKLQTDFVSLRGQIDGIEELVKTIDQAILDTADQVDKLKPLISGLDDQIDKLPQDLKEILQQTEYEVLFDATDVDTLKKLPQSLEDNINDYYNCE